MSSITTLFFAIFFNWLSRLGNLIVCFYLSCFLRIIMLQSRLELLRRDHVQLPVVMTFVATTFSYFQVVVSRPQFHVVTWIFFPLLNYVSRQSFFVATPFLLIATLILVATTFYGLQVFMSRPQFHVATQLSFLLLNYVSQQLFHVATPFLL